MYAWADMVAQGGGLRGSGGDGSFQVKAWRAIGDRRPGRGPGRRAVATAFPAVVAALNRAGLGPLRPDVSAFELRRAALRAFGEVLSRLEVPAAYVIFGHTHRAGPLPGDDGNEWRPARHRLVNVGSWVYEPGYLGERPRESPYRPGFAAVVGDVGPPELVNLLDGDA
jgi:hypothetical protein